MILPACIAQKYFVPLILRDGLKKMGKVLYLCNGIM
jgi:hypothetical protein